MSFFKSYFFLFWICWFYCANLSLHCQVHSQWFPLKCTKRGEQRLFCKVSLTLITNIIIIMTDIYWRLTVCLTSVWVFICSHSLSSYCNPVNNIGTPIILTFQMRKLRHRQVGKFIKLPQLLLVLLTCFALSVAWA